MSASPQSVPPPSVGLHPSPPISRGGARAAILSRLAAQGRSPDFLDEGAVGRLIDHARGSPRTLRAALDATLAQAAREGARRGDAALVGRALGEAAPARPIVTARTRRALWLAGSGFATAAILLIFVAPFRPARVALAPQAVAPAPRPAVSPVLAQAPDAHVAAQPSAEIALDKPPTASPEQPGSGSGPASTSAAPDAVAPPPMISATPLVTPPPPSVAPAPVVPAPAPPPTVASPASPKAGPGSAPPPAPPVQASPPPAQPAPAQTAVLAPLAPDIGVAAPPVPSAPIAADPPTALVLYAAGAPGVQQRLANLSTRLRQAGIGQIQKRAVPAGTALGRPVSFFDRGDLALAQRAAGVLASEGWPNLPVEELAPRMIRPRASLRQHHVVIELQLP